MATKTEKPIAGRFSCRIGRRIRWLRAIQDVTQEKVHKRCGVTAKTLARYERGGMPISSDTVERIAYALDVSPEDLCAPTSVFIESIKVQAFAFDSD